MKKVALTFLLLLVSASASGFMTVLDNKDKGPALSSTLDGEFQWKSFNQWQCFSLVKIDFNCVIYDESIGVPSISAENESEIFLFDVPVEAGANCDETLYDWRELVSEGDQICIFAAHMPDVDLGIDEKSNRPFSLWYIDQVKTAGGYWTP